MPPTPPSSRSSLQRFLDSELAADAASFDVTEIPVGGTELHFLLVARSARAAQTEDGLSMRFNNDATAIYDGQSVQALGSADADISLTQTLAGTSFVSVGTMPAASSPAGACAQVSIVIVGYAGTTFNKTFTSVCATKLTDAAGGIREWTGAGEFRSTAALTRVTLFPANADFLAGSRLVGYVLL